MTQQYPAPQNFPAQQPAPKRRRWPWVAAFVLVAAVSGALGANSNDEQPAPPAPPAAVESATVEPEPTTTEPEPTPEPEPTTTEPADEPISEDTPSDYDMTYLALTLAWETFSDDDQDSLCMGYHTFGDDFTYDSIAEGWTEDGSAAPNRDAVLDVFAENC